MVVREDEEYFSHVLQPPNRRHGVLDSHRHRCHHRHTLQQHPDRDSPTTATSPRTTMLESTLFYRPSPSTDPDDYPLISLTHCTITQPPTPRSPSPGPHVDLFTVSPTTGPFRLTGTLPSLPRKYHSIAKSPSALKRDCEITISKVETYSIERKKGRNGVVRLVIWVLGQAAWYSIEPSEEYMAVWGVVREKAECWMWLEQEWRGRWGEGVGELWRKFAEEHNKECRSPRAAMKLFHNHWKFLVQMMSKSHFVDEWRESSIWNKFLTLHRDEFPKELIVRSTTTTPALKTSALRQGRPRTRRQSQKLEVEEEGERSDAEVPQSSEMGDVIEVCTQSSLKNSHSEAEEGTEEEEKGEEGEEGVEEEKEEEEEGEEEEEDSSPDFNDDADDPDGDPASDTSTPSSDEEDEDDEDDEDDEGENEEEDDSSGDSATKTPLISSSTRGKTVSSKGRSILRPRRSTIPIAPPSPPSDTEIPTPLPPQKRRRLSHSPSPSRSGSPHLNSAHNSDSDTISPRRIRRAGDKKSAKRSSNGGEGKPANNQRAQPWTCTKCGFSVANTRNREGRHAVEEHYKTHAGVFVEAMRTVEMEKIKRQAKAKRELEVGNLLAKLSEMNRQWEEGRPSPLKGLE